MYNDVKFFAPANMEEALKLLADGKEKVTVLAGGTDLVANLNTYRVDPDTIMYIGNIGLDYIKEEDGYTVIGAGTTLAQILDSELLCAKAPAVVEAAAKSSSTAIHTVATIGGNIMNMSPAADMVPPLYAMKAELVLASCEGERTIAIGDFFKGYNVVDRKSDELLKEIRLPALAGTTVYEKLGKRQAQTLAIVSCAARVAIEDGKAKEICLAVGSMAETCVYACDAAKELIGGEITCEGAQKVAEAVLDSLTPIDDARATAWYRKTAGVPVVRNAICRAAGVACE